MYSGNRSILARVTVPSGRMSSFRLLRRGAGDPDPARARRHAWLLAFMYAAVAALLVVGMLTAHVPQDRL